MEDNDIMTIVALVISVGSVVIGAINHKRVRSNCLGAKTEVSLDIESTTPPTKIVVPA
jgi:hypothetical protein